MKFNGAELRAMRVSSGKTLKGLADAAGLTKGAISKLETGAVKSPTAETVHRVAAALGVEMGAFFAQEVSDGEQHA